MLRVVAGVARRPPAVARAVVDGGSCGLRWTERRGLGVVAVGRDVSPLWASWLRSLTPDGVLRLLRRPRHPPPTHGRSKAGEWDERHEFPEAALRSAAALGFGGLYVRAESGGTGLSRADALPIVEALAAADVR